MGHEILNFRISSGLKNLIGKELITDEYVAVFELVKNSFDANAKKVTIFFEDIYGMNPRIIIVDNGKGMDIKDIKEKWLFVAYSAKRDGTEDDEETKDHRNKIKTRKFYAGAKGVGRFSCDRLGNRLNMITVRDKEESKIENIEISWEDFEQNSKEEFADIGVKHRIMDSHKYNITSGTILEIADLRDEWNRKKILTLKNHLQKLINPNQQDEDFSIQLVANEEAANDSKQEDDWNKINGLIKNTVFEKLNLKTTEILTGISEGGNTIITTLTDRGKLIYKITEENPYGIKDVSVNLFYLNRAAKYNFTKIMGVEPINYGSVFMYKNGFRIYPFGEEGEDTLGLNQRKTQGYNRYLGTRELIGRIEIDGENREFIETTSRDGGLIKNKSYEELVDFVYEKALRRLEKYVVNIIKWGEAYKINKEDIDQQPALNPSDVKGEIIRVIERLTNSKGILSVEYDKDFFNIIDERQDKSVTKEFQELRQKTLENTNDKEIQKSIEKVGKKLEELIVEREEIEKEVDDKKEELKKVNKVLEQTTSQNLFLKSVTTSNTKEIIGLQHHINHGTVRIRKNLSHIREAIENNATGEEILEFVRKISHENNKISTISRFVTKANFNVKSKAIVKDLVVFINEYIENVYKEYKHLKINNQTLNIRIEVPSNLEFSLKFRPLEMIIVIDNLLNNATKAGAKNVDITWKKEKNNEVNIIFKDDGKGIPPENLMNIFDFGFTTTDGSGIGLFHVKDILETMGGYITAISNGEKGATFVVGIKNESGI